MGEGSLATVLDRRQVSQVAAPSRPAHAHAAPRARAHCPRRSPALSRARAHQPLVARMAHARGPAHRCLLPYPRISSALCSRLRTSRNTRVSAATTAMTVSGPHAGPEPGQSGSTCGRSRRLAPRRRGGIRRSRSVGYIAAFRAENALPRRPTPEHIFL